MSPTQFALAQERFEQNRQFAAGRPSGPRSSRACSIRQLCGYALYRYSTRTTCRRVTYYRCTGTDVYRFPEGRRCANRPVRQDAVEALVWEHVIRLLSNPALVRAEIDRRLMELRATTPWTCSVTSRRRSSPGIRRQRQPLDRSLPGAAGVARRAAHAHAAAPPTRSDRPGPARRPSRWNGSTPRRMSRSPRASKAFSPSSTMLPSPSRSPIASASSGWSSNRSRSGPNSIVITHSIPFPGHLPAPELSICVQPIVITRIGRS